ncbi:MAG: hypothetical protein EXQ60_05575 [Candidatus Nanopelagicales bacterium]|nr:hypothetical protein [Candidatus Nanopelagicales bacterium]
MSVTTLTLTVDDARVLAAFGRRQLAWDPLLPVRIVSTPSSVGLYTAPPLNVLALFAVPATITGGPIDFTVSLASLVAEFDATIQFSSAIKVESLREVVVPVTSAMSVTHLPPADGWQMPMQALAGDLMVHVDTAVAEFTTRSAGQTEPVQQSIADEIWERPTWAALPMRVLHAARRLGMMSNDQSRVSAATSGPWKRLATARGQVFTRANGGRAGIGLQVVR